MSNTSNQTILIWKDAEEFLSRRISLMFDDTTTVPTSSLSKVKDAYTLWYLSTWDTLLSFNGCPLTKADSFRWLNAILDCPLRYLVDLLKESSHLLVTGDFDSYDAFKQHLSRSYPMVGAILAPIRKVIAHWFSTRETDALNLCYSWTLFISRLNLSDVTQLETEALNNYLLIEETLQMDGFSSEESLLLEKWFPKTLKDCAFLTEHHSPSHGPGATCDAGKTMQNKYASLCCDQRIAMLNSRVYPDSQPYPRLNNTKLIRRSETIFVPKSLGSYRTISMEPATLMWHQKGVRSAILLLLKSKVRHPLCRRFEPDDQQSNRDRAWLGSIDGSFATIDLSSASDTVSWNLVKKWFRNTSLYPWLLWTRSTHTLLPNGQEIKLKKYAPMGSDLCFPIESIIFAAITECAIREHGEDPRSSDFKVFGDDIVVENEYAACVMQRLVANGFILNKDKTFSTPQPHGFFRESCGGFYYNGADITPVRLSRRFSGYSDLRCDNPGRIESIIELANDCFDRYPSVRRWLVKSLLTLPRHLQPLFSSDGTIGLYSLQPSNFHLKKSESVSLQCEVLTYGRTYSPKCSRKMIWEDIRLFEYLRRTDGRQRLTWPSDRVDVDVSPIPRASWTSKRSPVY